MKKTLVSLLLVVLALLLLSAPSAQQPGRILYVNNLDPACGGRSPCFTAIQTAVNAARAGDTIQIQAGSYPEKVTISGKNNVAAAAESDRIVIEADPSAPPGSVVVTGATQVCTQGFAFRLQQSKFITLRGLTIRGTGGQAIELMGGNNQNQAIHIERNRILGNGSSECSGGITVARGNPDTLIVNNLIYANGRNGITFIDADGGPHYIIENTIHSNAWSGIRVARSHEVFIVNNSITQNGTASGSTGGRFGVSREGSTSPQPQGIHLLNNLVCGNRLAEIDGPALDSTDSGNLTPAGSEGPGVVPSPGCQIPANVYANVNGPDGLANTADDDFRPANGSPAIDGGLDPRTIGLSILFNPILEADFLTDLIRPASGAKGGTPKFDIGAFEFVPPNQAPVANAGADRTVSEGTVFNLDGTGSFDPDNDPITYQWTQTAGPPVTLSNPTSATPTLTAPAVQATTVLTFQLTVSDAIASSTASVNITVEKANGPPVLNPIGNKTVAVGNILTFTLSAADPDGDALTFSVSPLPPNASLEATTGVFSFTPNQAQIGTLSLTFSVSDGRGGAASETITVTVTGELSITITTPADGATVPSGALLVRGTVETGGVEVGVSVNGVPAAVQGNNFVTIIAVTAETTHVTAVATTASGSTASHTVSVNVQAAGDSPIVFHASPVNGIAPLRVNFSLFSNRRLLQVDLDADGDGVTDVSGSQLDQHPFTFSQPGVYVATSTATDDNGNQFIAKVVIQVFDPTQLNNILTSKWSAMKDALRTGDIAQALRPLSISVRDDYQELFNALTPQLSSIDQILTDITLVSIDESRAEYKMLRIDSGTGTSLSYFVLFVIDDDGIWRLKFF